MCIFHHLFQSWSCPKPALRRESRRLGLGLYSLSNGDSPATILFFKHVGACHKGTSRTAPCMNISPLVSKDRKQWQRWRPGRQKWQPEVDIFPLSVLWLGTFVQREFKQRHSDSLCETEAFHQARHCYSWRPGHQRSRYLSLLLGSLNNNDGDGYENVTQKVN